MKIKINFGKLNKTIIFIFIKKKFAFQFFVFIYYLGKK